VDANYARFRRVLCMMWSIMLPCIFSHFCAHPHRYLITGNNFLEVSGKFTKHKSFWFFFPDAPPPYPPNLTCPLCLAHVAPIHPALCIHLVAPTPYFNPYHNTNSLSTQPYLTDRRSRTHQPSAPYCNLCLTIHPTYLPTKLLCVISQLPA